MYEHPYRCARALLSLTDPNADPDARLDGALLLWNLARDIHIIRIGLFKDG